MADGQAAYDPDRLPWLTETRQPRRRSESSPLWFWAFLAIVLVAGIAYWLGVKSARQPDDFSDIVGRSPSVTAPLPDRAAEQFRPVAPPQVRQVEAPGLPDVVPVAAPPPVKIPGVDRARPIKLKLSQHARVAPKARKVVAHTTRPAAPAAKQHIVAPRVVRTRLQAWPADQSLGAQGRVVRVGAFYTRRQAKKGWVRIVRVYPGIRRLRAVVVPVRSLRTGRTFYRLQFGTTSQAHSEVLCQRMRIVAQSCVTVGLPGRGTGGRR